jgi:hypothetical protein
LNIDLTAGISSEIIFDGLAISTIPVLEERDEGFTQPIYQLRITGGYKFFEHLGVFGGISYDIFPKNLLNPQDFGGLMLGGTTANSVHKFGFFGGVQF